jgi:hypothetical protein
MFLDIKLGLLWAFLVGLFFEQTLTPLWIVAGVVFALLPDIDFWIEYIERGTVGGKTIGAHRTFLHNPLPYIPVSILIGMLYGPAWMTLFALGVFGHFVHDLSGMGYGIRLFWPFSRRWYKLFSGKDGEIHYDFDHCIVSWSPEEMETLVADRGNDNWIKEELRYMYTHRLTIFLKLLATLIGIAVLVAILPL